jgi:hypothetical protein
MLALTLLFVLFLTALASPVLALGVFALCGSTGEAYGVSQFLAMHGLEDFTTFAAMPVLLGALAAFRTIFQTRKNPSHQRIFGLACGLMFCLIWTGLSATVAIGPQAIGSISRNVVEAGFPGALIALASIRSRFARGLFLVLLAFQLILAAGVTLLPDSPLDVVASVHFRDASPLGAPILEVYRDDIARIGEQTRLSAHFSGPGPYGLYSLVGIALGTTILLNPFGDVTRVIGVALLAVGLFGWSVTVYRGTTVGLLIGYAILGVVWTLRSRTTGRRIARVAVLGTLLVAAIALSGGVEGIGSAIQGLTEDTGTQLRIEALRNSMSQLLENPLFGSPDAAIESTRGTTSLFAHQIMFYYAANKGIVVGICVTVFLALIPISTIKVINAARQQGGTGHSPIAVRETSTWTLSILFGWLCVGTALTNNYTAPVIFWACWAEAATPWLFYLGAPPTQSPVRKP